MASRLRGPDENCAEFAGVGWRLGGASVTAYGSMISSSMEISTKLKFPGVAETPVYLTMCLSKTYGFR